MRRTTFVMSAAMLPQNNGQHSETATESFSRSRNPGVNIDSDKATDKKSLGFSVRKHGELGSR